MKTAAAVVIGLNYRGTVDELEGCISDARAMAAMLETRLGGEEVRLVTDEDGRRVVSRADVLAALGSFRDVEVLYMYFSGHGTQRRASTVELEVDGLDECLVCSGGELLRDDDLRVARVECGGRGVGRVVCIFDCCHSGTMVDTRINVRVLGDDGSGDVLVQFGGNSACCGGGVVSLSACLDSQVALESGGRGLFTVALLEGIASGGCDGVLGLMRYIDARTPPGQRACFGCDALRQVEELGHLFFLNPPASVVVK
jgi:uncharacterized caspase-like protein